MKRVIFGFCLSMLAFFAVVPGFLSKPVFALNRIDGIVYDPSRVPVNDVRVELQNELGSILSSSMTRAGGHFSFVGISSGRFLIRAVPLGLNFREESVSVEVINYGRATSSDTEYVEIYLRYDQQSTETILNRPAEVIFVQDVPNEAKKLYQSGISNFRKNPDKSISDLEEAIKMFPIYFDALSALGTEYIERQDFNSAYPYLIRAIDVNPRSFTSYYNLGFAFYKLDQLPAGLAAAKAAALLAPTYIDAQILLGTLLRMNGDYKEAESVLLKAKSLSKVPNPEIFWQLALVYNRLNRNEDAANELELYLKTNPTADEKKKTKELIAKLRDAKKS